MVDSRWRRTLAGAQARLDGVTGRLRELQGEMGKRTGPVGASLDQVSAGPGWREFSTTWSAALERLVHATETFVAYERTDEAAMPESSPVAPDPEKVRDAQCKPDMFGNAPDECRLA